MEKFTGIKGIQPLSRQEMENTGGGFWATLGGFFLGLFMGFAVGGIIGAVLGAGQGAVIDDARP